MVVLGIYKIDEDLELPSYSTLGSACFDIKVSIKAGKQYYCNPVWKELTTNHIIIKPKEIVYIPTGLIFDIPINHSVRIHPRSSTAKRGLVLANNQGIIDSDYIEEVFIIMMNFTNNDVIVNDGDRLVQAEVVKNYECLIQQKIVTPQQKTDRTGGFGSTGL